jgi:undecaprenyl-diphosphatase
MRVGRQARRTVLRAAVSAAAGALGAWITRRGRAGVTAAAATGAVAGAAQEWPPAAAAVPLAAVAARRDPLAAAVGSGLAAGTRRVWPVAPRHGADVVPRREPDPDARPRADGTGVRVVVNPGSGPALAASPTDALCEGLPGAVVIELDEGDDLVKLLHGGDDDEVVAVGAAGGDGTLSAAAGVALERDVPLVAVPSGTLNHLARDLGLASPDDAVAAVRAGTVTRMDVATFGERPFLNTASFGGYTEVVDAREQLEDRIGKWPALAVALTRVLRRLEPIRVEIDGQRREVWLVFIGNCRYSPPGFGPSWRERLDDGLLDVRLVDGRHPWARTRLILAVLTGTLARSAPYQEWVAERVEIRSLDGPLRVALDGEVFDADERVVVAKRPRALTVAVPPA